MNPIHGTFNHIGWVTIIVYLLKLTKSFTLLDVSFSLRIDQIHPKLHIIMYVNNLSHIIVLSHSISNKCVYVYQ